MMSIADTHGGGSASPAPVATADAAPVVYGATAVPLAWRVPQPHDHDDFMRLCEPPERARLRELGVCFAEIARAKTLAEGAAYAAARRRHLGRGWSPKMLEDAFRLWRDGGHKRGDWTKSGPAYPPRDFRALARAYRPGERGLPADFILFLGQTFAEFRGRADAVRAWYRHFVHEIWLADQPVPVYGKASAWYAARGRVMPHGLLVRPGDLPEGWGEDNLRLHLPKRKAIRAQLAHGYLAAHGAQPDQVLGDRSQLRPFERVFADDLRPDLRSLHIDGARGEIVYPLIILLLDACSGVDLANVAKPRALKEDGSRQGVSRDMMRLALVQMLRTFGRPPYPITIVHENAAACLTREDRALFEDAFGDWIQFEPTAVFRERMTAHGFVESGGCPWDKAPIEVFFRLLQTQLARLRGSTGPRYDAQHGELAAIEEYTLAQIDAAQGVREVIAQLASPLLRFPEAHDAIERALKLLRFRTRHKLQGFDRLVEAQLPDGRWITEQALALLPEAEQEAARIVARLECPAERFTRLLQGVRFEPVDPDLLTWLEGPRTRVTVRCGKITLQDSALASAPMIFREEGHTLLEDGREGRTYEAAFTADRSRVVLAEEGRLIGGVNRQERIDVRDREALHREQGRVHAARAADREMLRGYLANQDAHDAHLRAHNAAVLAAAPAIAAAAATAELAPAPASPALDTKALMIARAARLDPEA